MSDQAPPYQPWERDCILAAMLLAVAAVFMIWFWVQPQPAQDRELVAHAV